MSKPYIDHAETFAKQQKAMEQARANLESRGVFYPVGDSSISPEENYQRLMEYSEIEAHEIVKMLREPSGPRPLVIDNVKSKSKGWDGYND
jgi:hypothetical protein